MKSRALNLAALALLVSLCGWTGGVRPAAAQALDAGKPPAQIFSGTCSACHRSPRGLVRSVSPGSLPGFLRQHYTTGNDMAGVMAAYVLGNGGTQQVAEPPPKREPKQKAKSDGQDVAAHTPDAREQSKAARQKAAKKGQIEPAAKDAPAAKDVPAAREAEKSEPAKPETATSEPPKAEAAAVECKVEPPAKPAAAAADESKPPKQPTSLLTLPGFPAPEPEPEAEPEPAATAPSADCEPKAATTTAASVTPSAEPARAEPQKETPPAVPAPAPAAVVEAPKLEPLRSAVTETTAATPSVNIMQEELHAPRPRTGGQKKRAQQ